MKIELTKEQEEKIIECSTGPIEECDRCPMSESCNRTSSSCCTNVHAAARVLYGTPKLDRVEMIWQRYSALLQDAHEKKEDKDRTWIIKVAIADVNAFIEFAEKEIR